MITLCTVSMPKLKNEGILDIFQNSLLENLNLIDEVIIVSPESENEQFEIKSVKFKKIKNTIELNLPQETIGGTEHAFHLHKAIQESKNELILFSDPDIFYHASVDSIYIELMDKYKLDAVGISHQDSISSSIRFFPVVTHMLVKKSRLPPSNWLKNEITLAYGYHLNDNKGEITDGKYLIPGAVASQINKYPNPNGFFDTGNLLCPWSQESGWRWLSFQTADCHDYNLMYNRSNFKLKDKLPKQLLLHHGTHSASLDHKRQKFIESYHAQAYGSKSR